MGSLGKMETGSPQLRAACIVVPDGDGFLGKMRHLLRGWEREPTRRRFAQGEILPR